MHFKFGLSDAFYHVAYPDAPLASECAGDLAGVGIRNRSSVRPRRRSCRHLISEVDYSFDTNYLRASKLKSVCFALL
jgi:hypothetical protein